MVNFGILGMGKMGCFHAEWIGENKDFNLIAVCDKNSERLAWTRENYNVQTYDSIDSFLANTNIDFVVIVTTNDVHEEFTVLSLAAGKNVIVEKPMSMTYESTLRMIDAAEKSKKHLFVHQSSRWDRDFLLVKETIESGILGDILQIHSKVMLYDEGWPAWGIDGMKNPWRIKKAYGGGLLFDWGPHLIDQLVVLLKEDPSGVCGMLQSGIWATEVDDHFFALLKYDNNLICQIEVSNNGRISLPRWYVIGTKGTMEVKGNSEPFWDQAEILYVDNEGKKVTLSYKLHDICESGAEGGFYKDLVLFLNGKIKEFVSMYDSSKVIKILETVQKSHEQNKMIMF